MTNDADPPVAREDLLDVRLGGSPPIERVRTFRVELAPGQPAGPHRHPCHVAGYVLSGTIRFRMAGGAAQILRAGDAFHEPVDAHVLHFDNASDAEPAVFLACYLLGPGEDRLIEPLSG
jgi:quercetin dioxygenase-like cupin family protein